MALSRAPSARPSLTFVGARARASDLQVVAAKRDLKLSVALPRHLPAIVYLECVVAKLDGDPYNLLRPKECALAVTLQFLYCFCIAAPLHVFTIFASRPTTPTNHAEPFVTSWSMPTYLLIVHYLSQGGYLMAHYLGVVRFTRLWRYALRTRLPLSPSLLSSEL